KGTRRLQLENVMEAKFDTIMVPIAQQLIVEEQLDNVTFDAFFQNTMFHEVAHGLGIKNTLDGKGTVSEALKDQASSFEEGKADVLGLYMVGALADKGELDKSKLMDNYVTFLAGILRSVRFGAADAHARANMVRFNFFAGLLCWVRFGAANAHARANMVRFSFCAEQGAFSRDPESGKYRVDFERMQAAIEALSRKLLTIQGDGDYTSAKALTDEMGVI